MSSTNRGSPRDRRIMLIGNTGDGKSATGNTILGERKFISRFDTISVTYKCEYAETRISGRKVTVYDTPGFFDTKLSEDRLAIQIKSSIELALPGIHVFLFVIELGRFTMQSLEIVKKLEEMFGEGAAGCTMILFTHGDKLNGENIQTYINRNEHLYALVQKFRGMYHVFNNNNPQNREQVTQLLEKIDHMVSINRGSLFTSEKFSEAEKKLEQERRKRREQEESVGDRLEQAKLEIKKLEDTVKQQQMIIMAAAITGGAIIGGAAGGKVAAMCASSKLAVCAGAVGGSVAGAGVVYGGAKATEKAGLAGGAGVAAAAAVAGAALAGGPVAAVAVAGGMKMAGLGAAAGATCAGLGAGAVKLDKYLKEKEKAE